MLRVDVRGCSCAKTKIFGSDWSHRKTEDERLRRCCAVEIASGRIRNRNDDLRIGLERFNIYPLEGLNFLVESGVFGVSRPCNVALAMFFHKFQDIDRVKLGEFLCGGPENESMLRAFVSLFDFSAMPLDQALRAFLFEIALPNSHQSRPLSSDSEQQHRESAGKIRTFLSALPFRKSKSPNSVSRQGSGTGLYDNGSGEYDGKRVAIRLFSNHFWKMNEKDFAGPLYRSRDTVFALALQLVNLGDVRTNNGARLQWEEFAQLCQDIVFSLIGSSVPSQHLFAMFERTTGQAFRLRQKVSTVLSTQSSPLRAMDIGLHEDCTYQGYLRLEHPSLPYDRLWFALKDWVLYGLDEPVSPENGLVSLIIPLQNIQPVLDVLAIRLMGTLKISLGQQSFRQNNKNTTVHGGEGLNSRTVLRGRFTTRRSSTGSVTKRRGDLVEVEDLEFLASTQEEASRWYHALSSEKSREGNSVMFSHDIDTKKKKRVRDLGKRQSSDSGENVLDEILRPEESSGNTIKGRLFVKHPDWKGKGYVEKYCALVGESFIVSNDPKVVRKEHVIDLGNLRMVIPSTDPAAVRRNQFPFELIDTHLKTICLCAALTLKDYTVWFKAFSGLLSKDYFSEPDGTGSPSSSPKVPHVQIPTEHETFRLGDSPTLSSALSDLGSIGSGSFTMSSSQHQCVEQDDDDDEVQEETFSSSSPPQQQHYLHGEGTMDSPYSSYASFPQYSPSESSTFTAVTYPSAHDRDKEGTQQYYLRRKRSPRQTSMPIFGVQTSTISPKSDEQPYLRAPRPPTMRKTSPVYEPFNPPPPPPPPKPVPFSPPAPNVVPFNPPPPRPKTGPSAMETIAQGPKRPSRKPPPVPNLHFQQPDIGPSPPTAPPPRPPPKILDYDDF